MVNIAGINKVYSFLFVSAVFLLFYANQAISKSNTQLVFCTFSDKNSFVSFVGFRIVSNLYAKIGTSIQLKRMPRKRCLREANHGLLDGELLRTEELLSIYTNLIKINGPLTTVNEVAFTKKKLKVSKWEDLSPYKIGIMSGLVNIELKTRQMNRVIVTSSAQAFEMLSAERIDLVVFEYYSGMKHLKTINNDEIYPIEPPLQELPLFHYLHKKNKQYEKPLNELIEKMKKNGDLKQIVSKSLHEFNAGIE